MDIGKIFKNIKTFILGKSKDLEDPRIFHQLALIPFFAWVGLGADGLSSSCYGPQEAFLALGHHTYLSIFVGIGIIFTIFVITASYSQVVELFPTGGGGYLVASKLVSPTAGMISGCALLIDYVLTITVSIASGTDALFSFFPLEWQSIKLYCSVLVVALLIILNMRGAKESIIPLVPVFLIFVFTHIAVIVYGVLVHTMDFPQLVSATAMDIHSGYHEVGFWGLIFLILRAYSMGAGTFTGLEAVSNGITVLREPRVENAKSTMRYMAYSLSFIAMGLILLYLLFSAQIQEGKTLNAILFEQVTVGWGKFGIIFVFVALVSEALLLFVAAQTGFLGGPLVLANMALDRWLPTKFSLLSERLVVQNGVLIMGFAALAMMIFSHGSVTFLVVLYSINVFITFVLSLLGMVKYWWNARDREKKWKKKIFVSGTGLVLCTFVLLSMIVLKFHEGGWITILITGSVVIVAIIIKRHYYATLQMLKRLNSLVVAVESSDAGNILSDQLPKDKSIDFDPKAKTAVLLVSGFNGLGLHTLLGIIRLFGTTFRNFIFIEVGIVDAGNFKGTEEVEKLGEKVKEDLHRYVEFMNKNGFYAEGISSIGVDVIGEVEQISAGLLQRFPNAIFFGGQLIFPKDTIFLRLLHNHTVLALQKVLYRQGIPFVILPIRV